MSYTTSDLVSSVKRRASIPTSQDLFSESDLIAFANDELEMNLVPLILSAREEYLVADYDIAVGAGESTFRIPWRAIGSKLRDVQIINGTQVQSLPRLQEEDKTTTSETRVGFYIKGNQVIISPVPSSAVTLRLVHFRRPGTLVATTAAAQVSSIDTLNNQVTINATPSTFTNGVLVDFVRGRSGFESIAIDQEITGVSGTTITFDQVPDGLEVGDWLSVAGESPVPQIPLELHSVLVQAVVVKCLEALADPKVTIADQQLEKMKAAALNLITPRVDGSAKKIVAKPLL